jgi:TPP-dependent 2-oxoacid decarboxylase
MEKYYDNEEFLLKRKRELLQELDKINNQLKFTKDDKLKENKKIIKTIPITEEEFSSKIERLKNKDTITVVATGNLEYQGSIGDKILYTTCKSIEQVAWCLYGFIVNDAYESVLDVY